MGLRRSVLPRRVVGVVALAIAACVRAQAAAPDAAGKEPETVVVVSPHAPVKEGETVVAAVDRGRVLGVLEREGGRVKVQVCEGTEIRRGWLQTGHVRLLRDEDVDFAAEWLRMSQALNPQMDAAAYETRLGALVERLAAAAGRATSGRARAQAIAAQLFGREGFGTEEGVKRLDLVLDRKKGDCLSFSLLYLCAARRLKMPLHLVVTPDHAFVRYDDGRERLNIETTTKGTIHPDDSFLLRHVGACSYRQIGKEGLRAMPHPRALGCLLEVWASQLGRDGDHAGASGKCASAVEINPERAEGYAAWGSTLLNLKKHEEALWKLAAAAEANPALAPPYYNWGFALFRMKSRPEAWARCAKALEILLDSRDVPTRFGGPGSPARECDEGVERLCALVERVPRHDGVPHARVALGEALHEDGKYDEAAKQFSAFLEKTPSHRLVPRARLGLAQALLAAKKHDEAAKQFSAFLEKTPEHDLAPRAGLGLGQALYAARKYAEAIQQFSALAERAPQREVARTARLCLAESLQAARKPDEAIRHFSTFLEAAGDHDLAPRARDGLAWCYRKLGQPDRAVAEFLGLVRDHPKDKRAPHALSAAAAIRAEQKQHAEASQLYARLAAEFPDHPLAPEAAYRAGNSLVSAGQHQRAVEALQAFLAKHPKTPFADEALYDLGWAHRALKQPDAMVAALTRLVGEFPESKFATSTRLLLGSHHFDAKRYAEAAKHYQAAADRAAGDDLPKALYNLGWSLDKAEKPDEAAAAFDRLAGRAPDGPFAAEAHCLIGLIRQRQSKHDEAAARFQRALAAKPSPRIDEVALFGFGESLRTLGKPREALGTYQALIARYPEGRLRLDAQCGCGLASQQLGAYADAQEAFRKVIAATKTEAAARAQYGLGECEFLQGHYKEALAQYLAVDIRYAYEKWRAAALLKAMECHAKLGNPERVRFYHAHLARQFPKSELLPQANKLLDTLEPPKPRE